MNVKSFHISEQGASHIKKNKECQDASISYFDEDYAYGIVSDGHGGDDYVRSATGSMMACQAAQHNIEQFMRTMTLADLKADATKLIKSLEASIINDWNEAIYAHFEANPFTELELSQVSNKYKQAYLQQQRIENAYGATLLAVLRTKEYWIGIQIGDGKCVVVDAEGTFTQPIPWDDKCFLNATTSICDAMALSNFRHVFAEEMPAAIFVGTDGIDDCFRNEDQLNSLYKTVLYSFATSEFEEALHDLSDYLPRLSAKGSGDDVSIGAILDIDQVKTLDLVKNFSKGPTKKESEQSDVVIEEPMVTTSLAEETKEVPVCEEIEFN